MGGGHGLDGLRERIVRAGGTTSAGPTAYCWCVEIERAGSERPDIVLMDLRTPHLEGT